MKAIARICVCLWCSCNGLTLICLGFVFFQGLFLMHVNHPQNNCLNLHNWRWWRQLPEFVYVCGVAAMVFPWFVWVLFFFQGLFLMHANHPPNNCLNLHNWWWWRQLPEFVYVCGVAARVFPWFVWVLLSFNDCFWCMSTPSKIFFWTQKVLGVMRAPAR